MSLLRELCVPGLWILFSDRLNEMCEWCWVPVSGYETDLLFVPSFLKIRAHGLLESKGKFKEGQVFLIRKTSCGFTRALVLTLEAFHGTAERFSNCVMGILNGASEMPSCHVVLGFLLWLSWLLEGESLFAGQSAEGTREQASGRVDVPGEEHIRQRRVFVNFVRLNYRVQRSINGCSGSCVYALILCCLKFANIVFLVCALISTSDRIRSSKTFDARNAPEVRRTVACLCPPTRSSRKISSTGRRSKFAQQLVALESVDPAC